MIIMTGCATIGAGFRRVHTCEIRLAAGQRASCRLSDSAEQSRMTQTRAHEVPWPWGWAVVDAEGPSVCPAPWQVIWPRLQDPAACHPTQACLAWVHCPPARPRGPSCRLTQLLPGGRQAAEREAGRRRRQPAVRWPPLWLLLPAAWPQRPGASAQPPAGAGRSARCAWTASSAPRPARRAPRAPRETRLAPGQAGRCCFEPAGTL